MVVLYLILAGLLLFAPIYMFLSLVKEICNGWFARSKKDEPIRVKTTIHKMTVNAENMRFTFKP